MNFYSVLKNSYKDKKKQTNGLDRYGYVFDSDLSNDNEQVYFNPKDNKLLYSVTGTHNLSDWGTDAYLAAGKLKDTNRYKEADKGLAEAKKKYGVDSATITGHSLGATVGSYIAKPEDRFYGLDPGVTLGQHIRPNKGNHQYFRSAGDIVSGLSDGMTNMKTLVNPNKSTGILPIDMYKAHDINNIKNSGIRV